MSVHTAGSRGIYAEDAGLTLDTYCDGNHVSGCVCQESYADSCSFSGFTTAVEVNTTGNQYPVVINQVRFSNNETDVRINGNNYATVTRCDFDLQVAPSMAGSRCGLYLNNSTGYKVEENSFYKQTIPEQEGKRRIAGVLVNNSGGQANSLYRNTFTKLSHGIYVMGNNSSSRSGLVMTCGTFMCNKYDIFVGEGATVWQYQGNTVGADNSFDHTMASSFYNAGSQGVLYAYSNENVQHVPYNPYNITTYNQSMENMCSPTLCDGGTPRSLAQFQSDADADTYYTAVRTLMSDTVLDLNELEQWHTAAQSANLANYANIGDPYSLAETRFMEGYAELFTADADDAEMANYAEFHALKLALRDNAGAHAGAPQLNSQNSQNSPKINWYSLTESQIAQLQTIAERNTGRASVMAKGVLCFFHGICYEDEWDDAGAHAGAPQQGDDTTGARAKHIATDNPDDASLTVYPNPTEDILFIELSGGAGIVNMVLYDLQGRVVGTRFIASATGASATVNMRDIPAGVYVLRVTDTGGKEYHRKIVRK